MPPAGQGLAALQMLNILENFDLKGMGRDSPDFWHVMVEAKKLALEDRTRYWADAQFAEVPLAQLLDKKLARRQAGRIVMDRAARTLQPSYPHRRAGRRRLPAPPLPVQAALTRASHASRRNSRPRTKTFCKPSSWSTT